MCVSQAPSGASSLGDFLAAVCIALIEAVPPTPSATVVWLLRGHAAVERENRAGREPALLAREKQDAGRDFLRGSQAAHELPRRERLFGRVGIGAVAENLVEIRRVDRAGRHRVAADAVADVAGGD